MNWCKAIIISIFLTFSVKSAIDSQELLFNGARTANLKAIKKALNDTTVNVNGKNKDGETVLTLIARWGGAYKNSDVRDIVLYLLDHGADLNIKNKKGELPIEICKEQGVTSFLKALYYKELMKNTDLSRDIIEMITDYSVGSDDMLLKPKNKAIYGEVKIS